ncbi:MAG: hypothetical protein ACBZ72_04555 [Candidatus Bathyarchaeia archaeon]|jgi:hypothetical protein
MLDPVIVDGDAAYLPTYRVYLKGEWYVIKEVVDAVEDNMWDTELKI